MMRVHLYVCTRIYTHVYICIEIYPSFLLYKERYGEMIHIKTHRRREQEREICEKMTPVDDDGREQDRDGTHVEAPASRQLVWLSSSLSLSISLCLSLLKNAIRMRFAGACTETSKLHLQTCFSFVVSAAS